MFFLTSLVSTGFVLWSLLFPGSLPYSYPVTVLRVMRANLHLTFQPFSQPIPATPRWCLVFVSSGFMNVMVRTVFLFAHVRTFDLRFPLWVTFPFVFVMMVSPPVFPVPNVFLLISYFFSVVVSLSNCNLTPHFPLCLLGVYPPSFILSTSLFSPSLFSSSRVFFEFLTPYRFCAPQLSLTPGRPRIRRKPLFFFFPPMTPRRLSDPFPTSSIDTPFGFAVSSPAAVFLPPHSFSIGPRITWFIRLGCDMIEYCDLTTATPTNALPIF